MILASVIGIGVAVKFYYRTPGGRKNIDRLLLKVPIIGDIFRKIAVARFSRTLSTLLSSGVPILQSLDITAKTSGNVIIEEAITKVRTGVERGESFVDPLKATEVFPHMVAQMIGIGEQTGALDAMLGKIADFYEAEVDSAIANLLTLIEPLLIGFLGVTIGSIVIAMYLPLVHPHRQTLAGPLKQAPNISHKEAPRHRMIFVSCLLCLFVACTLFPCYNPLTPATPYSTLLQHARRVSKLCPGNVLTASRAMTLQRDSVQKSPKPGTGAILALRYYRIRRRCNHQQDTRRHHHELEQWCGTIFGYTADEVIGKPVTILIPADHEDEEPTILARLRAGHRIEHYETVRVRKDGRLIDISLTVSPIRGPDGADRRRFQDRA